MSILLWKRNKESRIKKVNSTEFKSTMAVNRCNNNNECGKSLTNTVKGTTCSKFIHQHTKYSAAARVWYSSRKFFFNGYVKILNTRAAHTHISPMSSENVMYVENKNRALFLEFLGVHILFLYLICLASFMLARFFANVSFQFFLHVCFFSKPPPLTMGSKECWPMQYL